MLQDDKAHRQTQKLTFLLFNDISILLNHSEQMDSLTAAHLLEFSVLLEDKRQLREALCNEHEERLKEHEENNKLKEIIDDKDAEIQRLKQRIADLENQTVVNNIAGPYIENNHVDKMYVRLGTRKPHKKSLSDVNQPQLQLWGT